MIENQIITAITGNLADITQVNGYSFDLTGVFEWRESDLDESELDAVEIRDISNEPYEDDELQHLLVIEATLVSAGGTTPAVHRQRVQDVITALSLIENESFVVGAMFMGSDKDSEKQKKRYLKTMIRLGVIYQAERWEI